MASIPPTELPTPGSPTQPDAPAPEFDPPGTDTDYPDPSPAGDPGTSQPAEI